MVVVVGVSRGAPVEVRDCTPPRRPRAVCRECWPVAVLARYIVCAGARRALGWRCRAPASYGSCSATLGGAASRRLHQCTLVRA